nr:uncharacterized protein LOC129468506 isoform X1 [Symphalangus syndactylus]
MSPGGSSRCVRQGGESTGSAGDRWGNRAEHAPGGHFVTRIYPPKPIRKKGRKETPAFSYCASASALPAVPPPSAGRAPYAAHEPRSLETGAGLRLPVSRKRARADVNLGAGASSSGLGCRLKWGRLRVFQAVRALVAAEGPATHEEFRRGRNRIAIGLRERLHFLSALLLVWPCGQAQNMCSDDGATSRSSPAWKMSPGHGR